MTANEIKKAIECCFIKRDHKECPFKEYGVTVSECRYALAVEAIGLINLQEYLIKRTEKERSQMLQYGIVPNKNVGQVRAEAIIEYAERLKKEAGYFDRAVALAIIDSLVAEMVG